MAVLCHGLALLLLFAAPAAAENRSYSIESLKVFMQVHPDASLMVDETITFLFKGPHQEIFRLIPSRYERQGVEHVLRIASIRVFGENGQPLKTEVSYPGRYVKITTSVPDAQDTKRTITIRYRVQRALQSADHQDELYWNVTGNEWEAPIRSAEATIALPREVPMESVRALAYMGPLGAARQDFTLNHTERFLYYQTLRPLRPREGLTLVVVWPSGRLRFPSRLRELGWLLFDQPWVALPFVVLAACLVAWYRMGRDPLRVRSIKPEYEPPEGLRPGEAGTLVDETVHPRDVVATLVDLAVRGSLTIEQVTNAFEERDYLFKLQKPWMGDPAIAPFEVIVLAQIFGAGGVSKLKLLSEIRRDYNAIVQPIQDQLYRDLVEKKYFLAPPQTVRRFWSTVGGLGLAIPLGALWAAGAPDGLPVSSSTLAAFAVSGLIVLGFARVMPRKTLRGTKAKLQVLGFQEFLERAEKDRLKRLAPDTLHKWLSYAIALGVEEAWIWNFDEIAVSEPEWYESNSPFTLHGFSSQLRGFAREVQDAWRGSRRTDYSVGTRTDATPTLDRRKTTCQEWAWA
jgi:hypothetical protein